MGLREKDLQVCAVPGCLTIARSRFTLKPGYICDRHWFRLPMQLRVRFWKETDYGEKAMPPDLLADIVKELQGRVST